MQEINFIKLSNIEEVKNKIQSLYHTKKTITVELKRARAKYQSYNVTIEGVYNKFFTVRDNNLKANFTIQYVDVLTDNVTIPELIEKEGF